MNGDTEAVVSTFAPNGYFRGPFGPDDAYHGTAELRSFYAKCFSAGGGIGLQDDFVGIGGGEETSLHAFESVAGGGTLGQAGYLCEMAGFAETQIAGEAKFGIDLEDMRELREFAAGVLIERARDDIAKIGAGAGLAAIVLISILAVARAAGA